MVVKKRDGREVEFDESRIITAIEKAFVEVDGNLEKENGIIERVVSHIVGLNKDFTVEEIQDLVENKLLTSSRKDVAKAYILYRDKRRLVREALKRDNGILSLIKGVNEELNSENSNKNATLVTTQRDYIAGEVSKDLIRRYNFFPKEVIEAHDEGLIHLSDLDYQLQPIHNCFDINTKFVTENGMKAFCDFKDKDTVNVLSLDGKYHKAIVKNYGKQPLYKYTFYSGKKEHTYEVLATESHRWILSDGSHTTNLSIGDKLIKAPVIFEKDLDFNSLKESEKLMWCKGFALGDGTVEFKGKRKKSNNTRIRLCGEKNKFLYRFKNTEGCSVRGYVYDNEDREVVVSNYKKDIPKFKNLNEMKCFFNGLYSADGRTKLPKKSNRINYCLQSSDKTIIEFIRKYADSIGLYITKENDLTGEVTNLTGVSGRKYTVLFSFNPNFYFNYTVLKKEFIKYDEVWCLNVEDTHNFILEHGIPTGNCELINLEDMLQNGTVINGVKIDKPNSFSTACTIATQIVVQVTSNSYGGATISLAHLSPFIQVTRDKLIKEWGDKLSKDDIEKLVYKDVASGLQTIQYQLITISGTNGQSSFLSLFLNINEVEDGQGRKDLAMAIEEVLKQRILGVKNEKGMYVTTAFPKLLYVLDENNIKEDSEYWYLTKLGAECTAKRLVPDYISAKKMRELKGGNVFPCMG